MNDSLLRHAFILILISLIGALFIPAMVVPRLGVSAHTIGVLGGVLLIGIGIIWPRFVLSPRQTLLHKWSWLYVAYINWFACFLGGLFGSGSITPVASGGHVGPPLVELAVSVMLTSVAPVSFLAVALSLWGLRAGAVR